MQITPYLAFNGKCREAFEYYAQHLRGQIVAMIPFSDAPAGEMEVSPEDAQRIMHAYLQVGEGAIMASDCPLGMPEVSMQGLSVSLGIATVEEAERIFAALADGGEVTMPIQETFWAARFGMVTDRFGTPWMINCEKPH